MSAAGGKGAKPETPHRIWVDGKPLRSPAAPPPARWHAGLEPIVKTEVEFIRGDLVRALIGAVQAGVYRQTKALDGHGLHIEDGLAEAYALAERLDRTLLGAP